MRLTVLSAVLLTVTGCAGSGTYPEQCGQLLPGWVTNEHGFSILGIASDFRLKKDGQLTLNRAPITDVQLARFSQQLGELEPSVFVTFKADKGASCERVRTVRSLIDSGVGCANSRGKCGEGPGPWPVFGDVPPFPIVQEYSDGHYTWLKNGVTTEEWLKAKAKR